MIIKYQQGVKICESLFINSINKKYPNKIKNKYRKKCPKNISKKIRKNINTKVKNKSVIEMNGGLQLKIELFLMGLGEFKLDFFQVKYSSSQSQLQSLKCEFGFSSNYLKFFSLMTFRSQIC
ncbi:hypothetical protein pb186bvf_001586 [Paramecium bursaria]